MSPALALRVVNGWDTVRYELLNTRLCDMGLQIAGSPMEPFLDRLARELSTKGLNFIPEAYVTDGWGCPDGVPIIGIPFYLFDKRLAKIEEEQTGEVETSQLIMMLLRHEAGHAFNYAYRLYRHDEWAENFGSFSRPYHDTFQPNPFSKQFVRHIVHHQYGKTYAQKHPDEDFAETFAVWLTPRSGWRRKYHNWPALRKLEYVDELMKSIRDELPRCTTGSLCTPVEQMDMLLAEHYGQRAERYREMAQGYVDDKLREIFPPIRARKLMPAGDLFRKFRQELLSRVIRWSELEESEVEAFLTKLQDRADFLNLELNVRHLSAKVLDVSALLMALAKDFVYTGQVTG